MPAEPLIGERHCECALPILLPRSKGACLAPAALRHTRQRFELCKESLLLRAVIHNGTTARALWQIVSLRCALPSDHKRLAEIRPV